MALVICENHEPPLVFTIAESLRRDSRDDSCPVCGHDDALVQVTDNISAAEYARQHKCQEVAPARGRKHGR